MESSFSHLIDLLPGLVWTALPDGRADFVNKRWCEYTGLSLEEARGSHWLTAIHPDDRPSALAVSGDPGELEARLRRFDGEYRWFLLRTSPIAGGSGEVARWCGVATDIEDRKRREKASQARDIEERKWVETLLAGEKRLLSMVAQGDPLAEVLGALCRTVEDAAPGRLCSVLSVDPDGARFRHGAGPSLPAAYNEVLDGLIMDRDHGPCGMAANLKTQVIVEDVTSDPRWAASSWPALVLGHGLQSCWSTPILSRDDKVIGVFALYQNEPSSPSRREFELIRQFTQIAGVAIERAQGDASLRRSNAFLAEAQDISATGSFSWRVATDEVAWSEQVYRMFEYDAAMPITLELIGARVHPDDLPALQDMIESARLGVADFEYEHRLLLPDGSIKHLHMKAHGTPDQGGHMEYIGAVQEVTDRRVSEEALSKVRSELAHMARATSLGALAASIAHEVNQPLSGIITNANTCLKMLAADPPNVVGAQETARRTVRDGNRAANIIKRLRTLFGKRDPTGEPVDLSEAAQEIIALSWSDLQRARVIVRAELAEDLPRVTGDRVQLQQVILNLLLNAADAMSGIDDRPRQLMIRTQQVEKETVSLTVQDVGVGLEPESAEKVFEAFYTTKSDGMGIGLSISRSIIDNHGGRLWARPNDGPGVSFTFSVPCTSDGQAAAPEPVRQPAAAGPQPPMVKR
jgi:PAS domain S-box-containing protein